MSEMSTAVRWTRTVLFLSIAAWMLSGPVYRQVIGGTNPHIREWRMYGTRAVRTCKVLFDKEGPNGWEQVSRWEIEGFTVQRWPSRGARMLDKPKDAVAAGERLCKKLGPGTALRYRRRCGHVRRGWSDWETSGDLCGAGR
jgi:hypothetical protein